ncbi:MAG: hypothetical protein AB7Q97_17685 [Gammaproteobacteria bacterium]
MLRNPAYPDLPDYPALRALYPFRMQVHAPGFKARPIIEPGDGFFDIMLGWRDVDRIGWCDADGSVVFGDIGGQRTPAWDPARGHGSIWRLHRDDRLEAIVPPGNVALGTVFEPRLAPANFGRWGGHIFFAGQTAPGRPGATRPHAMYRVAPGTDTPEVFAVMPDNGRIGGGISGALMPGTFGRAGSPFDGFLFAQSFMNCTVYRIDPDGRVDPFLTLDSPQGSILPLMVFHAPPWWGDLAGELILHGVRGASFQGGADTPQARGFWRVGADGAMDPVQAPVHPRALPAPREFGPFAGELFWADDGPVNLAQVSGCDEYATGLPYCGRILRRAADGTEHVFADGFYGSFTSLTFDGPRLLLGLTGRSYSTGEYHEPDGALYEVRHTG